MRKKSIAIKNLKKRKTGSHRVKVRLKVRKKFFKKFSLGVSFVLVIVVFGFSLKMVYGFVSGKIKSGVFDSEIKSLDIRIENEDIKDEILNMLDAEIGEKWDNRKKSAVKKELASKYPYVNGISISQNFLNGRLEIEGEIEKFVSKIKLNGNNERYLSLSGKIYSFAHQVSSANFIDTEVYSGKKNQLKDFAEFMDKMNSAKRLFKFKPVLVKYSASERECTIVLEDNSHVNWGKFEFTDLKVLRLNSVLEDIIGKIKSPYKVNLEYFAAGKVFISELGVGKK